MFRNAKFLESYKERQTSKLSESKHQKICVILRLYGFVIDDVNLGLKYLSLFAFKLTQHLAVRTESFKKATVTAPKAQRPSALISNHSQALIKILNLLHTSLNAKRKPNSKQIITVLRSPFIYKKTREQFAFQRHNIEIKLSLTLDCAQTLLPILNQLRLPCEFKIFTRARG